AASGFVTPYLQHGRRALDVLYYDQIGARPFVTSLRMLLGNVTSYLVGTAVDLLPWTLLLAVVLVYDRSLVRRVAAGHRRMYVFGIGWWLALVAIFATHDFMRPRYLAPTYPVLAVVIVAVLLEATRVQVVDRAVRTAAGVLLGALGAVGAVIAV